MRARIFDWVLKNRALLLVLLCLLVGAPFSPPIIQILAGSGLAVTNGLGPTVTVAASFGNSSGTITQGNDTRLPPTPSGAGKVISDNGSAYVAVSAGTATQVLIGGSSPSFAAVPLPTGVAFGMVWVNPVAAATTGLGTITANSGSNIATGIANPDVYRAVQITTGPGWDGGTCTYNGTRYDGTAVSISLSAAGSQTSSSQPWLTVTGGTKTLVGASSDTCSLGPFQILGVPTGNRSVTTTGAIVTVNNVLDSAAAIFNTSGDPQILMTTAPNGARTFVGSFFLQ